MKRQLRSRILERVRVESGHLRRSPDAGAYLDFYVSLEKGRVAGAAGLK